MKKLYTGAYLLTKGADDNKGFGYVQGFVYLPDYNTDIKVYIHNDKFSEKSDVDNMQVFTVGRSELESINKATQFVNASLETLISLSKRNLLKDEYFAD